MAIYRPEQAQLTYGPEASFGADSELARPALESSGWTAAINQAGGLPAGSLEIVYDTLATSTVTVGDFVAIGNVAATYGETVVSHEIRRIEWHSGTTIGLDRPTGFFHADDQELKEVDALYTGTTHKKSKKIRNVPGVYETVDAPDLAPTLEPQYFLGTKNRRSFHTVLKSQQSFDTALSMTPLNGLPFRWSIGKVTTCAEDMNSAAADQTTLNGAIKKGDIIVRVDDVEKVCTMAGSGSGVVVATAGDYITFTDSTNVSDDANTDTAVGLMGSNPESRRVVYARSASGLTGDGYIWLDQPLQFDHIDDSNVISHGVTTDEKFF